MKNIGSISFRLALCFIFVLMLWAGCKKEEEPEVTLPEVTTLAAIDITAISATAGGIVVSDGGSVMVTCGVVWHTDSNVTLQHMTAYTTDSSASGTFAGYLNNLIPNTDYYHRAYATNSAGTVYGDVLVFRTLDTIPELTAREKTINDYEDNYIGSMVSDPGWTGNVNGCLAGTISQDAKKKVLQRLNYFRRLVGLSDNVTENTTQHQGCMEASLIFKAQNNLSQYPPQHWSCWTQAGYNAAGTSNIAWGVASSGDYCVHTSYGVTGFMEDPGSYNKPVVHRAWLLMPGLQQIGIGSTNSTACLQWQGNYTSAAAAPGFIAYPPPGYIPNQITFPRWSFTIPAGGSFTNAQVTMEDENGATIPLNVINKPVDIAMVAPLKYLVWEPQINPKTFTADKKFIVTITGITGASQSTYSYEVIVVPVIPSYKTGSQYETDHRIIMPLSQ